MSTRKAERMSVLILTPPAGQLEKARRRKMKSKHSLLSQEAGQQKEETKPKLTRGHKSEASCLNKCCRSHAKVNKAFLNSGINIATTQAVL